MCVRACVCVCDSDFVIHICAFEFAIHPIFGKERRLFYFILSYDVASGSEITPCNKINKPQVAYRFLGNVMTSITTLRT